MNLRNRKKKKQLKTLSFPNLLQSRKYTDVEIQLAYAKLANLHFLSKGYY